MRDPALKSALIFGTIRVDAEALIVKIDFVKGLFSLILLDDYSWVWFIFA
jgi:hypothetical protein